MAAPLKSGKQSVNLAAPVRVSRIRRDPPPIAKKVIERDPDERDTRIVVIGVAVFALAIFMITLGASVYYGMSASSYTVEINNL
jgi:hypothetical protein